ncbi:MAG: hypothetical protein LQ340_005566, partial [Diploschistes diacapsis]
MGPVQLRGSDLMERTSEEGLVRRTTADTVGTAGIEMNDMSSKHTHESSMGSSQDKSTTALLPTTAPNGAEETTLAPQAEPTYKVYKRRWLGFAQLVLLNIMVSWGWLSYAPVANTAASYFSTTPAAINWLNVGFFFAFVVISPLTNYTLAKFGPRSSILAAAAFLILGNWIRYAGTRSTPPSYAAVMVGQVLIGFAQPFVLAAPTSFSDLWFTPRGRITATAITTLANPLGGAL